MSIALEQPVWDCSRRGFHERDYRSATANKSDEETFKAEHAEASIVISNGREKSLLHRRIRQYFYLDAFCGEKKDIAFAY
jgi:hypothetical protein